MTAVWIGDELWTTRCSGQLQCWRADSTAASRVLDLTADLRSGEELYSSLPFENGDGFWVATSLGRVLAVDGTTGAVRELAASLGRDRNGDPFGANRMWLAGRTLYAHTPVALIPIAIGGQGEPGPVLRQQRGQLLSLSPHPTRAICASASTSGHVLLFDLTDGRELARSVSLDSTVMSTAWGGDDVLFAATRDGRVVAMDANLSERWRLELGVMLGGLALSPDGRHLAVKCPDRHARIVSTDGRLVLVLPEITGRMQTVRFSPDGRQVVVTSFEGEVHIWPLLTDESGVQILDSSPYQEALDTARHTLGR